MPIKLYMLYKMSAPIRGPATVPIPPKQDEHDCKHAYIQAKDSTGIKNSSEPSEGRSGQPGNEGAQHPCNTPCPDDIYARKRSGDPIFLDGQKR